ncbi:MAG: thioredoxin fold domain-containing protein, partial [Limnobacter sp.]|nr:thioredoxin fold domain-containing protein [Limnobacter sp.]
SGNVQWVGCLCCGRCLGCWWRLRWCRLGLAAFCVVCGTNPLPGAGFLGGFAGRGVCNRFLLGSSSLLKPLQGEMRAQLAVPDVLAQAGSGAALFETVQSVVVAQEIAASGQPVLLDFYADWCVSCHEFELFTLTDPGVNSLLSGVRLLRVDVTANTEADRALMKQYSLFGPPALLFFDAAGSEQGAVRVVGFQNAQRFSETLMSFRQRVGLPLLPV